MNKGVAVSGINETKKFLATLQGQIPYATSVALNKTGKEVIEAQKDEMRKVFDEPTPWALGAMFKTQATKTALETRTRIKKYKGDTQGQTEKNYIGVQIYGGRRQDKGSEKYLRQRGMLPSGYQMVPGRGATLNKYGNVTGTYVQKILKALPVGYTGGKTTAAAGNFFITKKGIFRRMVKGGEIRPIFHFVKRPKYAQRFDYQAVSTKTFERRWKSIFDDAISEALRTAR